MQQAHLSGPTKRINTTPLGVDHKARHMPAQALAASQAGIKMTWISVAIPKELSCVPTALLLASTDRRGVNLCPKRQTTTSSAGGEPAIWMSRNQRKEGLLPR